MSSGELWLFKKTHLYQKLPLLVLLAFPSLFWMIQWYAVRLWSERAPPPPSQNLLLVTLSQSGSQMETMVK